MTETKAHRYNKKPTMQDIKIINENLVLLFMKKLSVTLNNPIAVGMSILEISKWFLYDFFYNYLKQKFLGAKMELIYTDTDCVSIFVEYPKEGDVYKDLQADQDLFDMSGYDPKDPMFGQFHNPKNHKVLGKMADEYPNCIITHFVAPRPKMYCVRYEKTGSVDVAGCNIVGYKKKGKGIGRAALNSLKMEHYQNALEGIHNEDVTMQTIRSFGHQLYTTKQTKQSVCGLDVKRYCVDSKRSLAHGHIDIPLHS